MENLQFLGFQKKAVSETVRLTKLGMPLLDMFYLKRKVSLYLQSRGT